MLEAELERFFIEDRRVQPSRGHLARDREVVRLEPRTMDVSAYLASHPNEVVTREQLERDVWHGATGVAAPVVHSEDRE